MKYLDEIEARANAATDGPWVHNPINGVHTPIGSCVATTHRHDIGERRNDAAFIAASRTDVPALVAALRAVLVEVDGIEGLATEHGRLDFDPSHKAMATAYSLSARGLRAAITSALGGAR